MLNNKWLPSKSSRLAIALCWTLTGSGCAYVKAPEIAQAPQSCPEPQVVTVYKIKPLTPPERPKLPHLSQDDVSCLTDAAYRKLVERDRLRREYTEELEVLIRTTQQNH